MARPDQSSVSVMERHYDVASHVESAAVSLAGLTAWQALFATRRSDRRAKGSRTGDGRGRRDVRW